MALTERTVIDQINVLEDGQIQVRRTTRVFRNSVEIAKTYHRHVIQPGQDYSKEDLKVQAHCQTAHTPVCVAEYRVAVLQQAVVLLEKAGSTRAGERLVEARTELADAEAALARVEATG